MNLQIETLWRTPPGELILSEHAVHVWRAWLVLPGTCVDELARRLSADEHARAQRLRFEQDRRKFILTRSILRSILGRYLHVEPSRLEFSYGEQGKPRVMGSDGETLEFNISHAHDAALYAFTRLRPIGIDVELVRPIPDRRQVAGRFFSRRENRVLQSIPEAQRDEAFFNCWTRKEAYIKALGEGLSQPLDRFAVSLAPGEPARVVWLQGDRDEPAHWRIEALFPFPSYVGAVALRTRRYDLSQWDWHPSTFCP